MLKLTPAAFLVYGAFRANPLLGRNAKFDKLRKANILFNLKNGIFDFFLGKGVRHENRIVPVF